MAWILRAAAALSLSGCLGDPQLVSCDEHPDAAGCETTGGPDSTSMSVGAPPTTEEDDTVDDETDADATTSTDDDDSTSTGSGTLPPRGICYREPSPLQAVQNGDVFTVSNDLFEMVMEEGDNYIPRRLAAVAAAPQNLLYTGVSENERFMGVQLWPTSFAYDVGVDTPAPPLAWQVEGAVVRFETAYVADDSTSMWIQSGNATRYTITPDGRMTRLEQVRVNGTTAGGQWLNAYIALDDEHFDTVQVLGDGISETYDLDAQSGMLYPDDTPQDEENLEVVLLCASDEETGVAVGMGTVPWPSQSDDPTHPPDPVARGGYAWGLRVSHPAGETIGMQLDWGRDFQPSNTDYHTHFMQMVTVAPGDPCGCMHEQFRAYVEPPALDVDGGTLVFVIPGTQEGENDAVMDGYFSDGGYYAIAADGNQLEVTVDRSVPTLLLRIVGVGMFDSAAIIVRLDGVPLQAGIDFIASTGNSLAEDFYLFLARELPEGHSLEIEYSSPGP